MYPPENSVIKPAFHSIIEPATIAAYCQTHYSVMAPVPFTLLIGQINMQLLALFAQQGVSSAAFITAFNPFSHELSPAENLSRQETLESEIDRRGLVFFRGEGRHPTGNWPAEASLLVMGLRLDESRELGQQFEQNAIVWADSSGCPQLVLLR